MFKYEELITEGYIQDILPVYVYDRKRVPMKTQVLPKSLQLSRGSKASTRPSPGG